MSLPPIPPELLAAGGPIWTAIISWNQYNGPPGSGIDAAITAAMHAYGLEVAKACAQACEDTSLRYAFADARRSPEMRSDGYAGAQACQVAIDRLISEATTNQGTP